MPPRRVLVALALCCVALAGGSRREGALRSRPQPLIFDELCAQREDPGPCKALKDHFFFDVNSGRCRLFQYGGCGGNDNNFLSLEECQEACVVSDDKDPCHLPEAPGPCRGLITRYFFDGRTRRCQHFFYGGCFGNANNFRSLAECQAHCPRPGKPTSASHVHTPPPPPPPSPPTTAAAVRPTGGTGGTGEPDAEAVREALLQSNGSRGVASDPGPSERCRAPVDRGSCRGAERRFAFDPQTGRCQMFSYSGCGGNQNNFLLRKHCIHKCIRTKKGEGRKMIRIKKKNIESIVNRLE